MSSTGMVQVVNCECSTQPDADLLGMGVRIGVYCQVRLGDSATCGDDFPMLLLLPPWSMGL